MAYFFTIILTFTSLSGITLQEVYDNSTSENGYDKYITLDNNEIYYGGFLKMKMIHIKKS